MISMLDLGWAAGFLEGEGSVHKNGCCSISACQKEREPLEKLQCLFGGDINYYDYPPQEGRKSRRQFYVWALHSDRGAALMMTLYQLLSNRRRGQVEVALERWKKVKSKKFRALSAAQVKYIRQAAKTVKSVDLARELEVHPDVVYSARKGRTYRYVK